jgi:LysM repeat protein
MIKKINCWLFLLVMSATWAQTYIKHTVAKGETIASIAQKYKVTPYDIYKLNPDSQKGITPNEVVLVPNNTNNSAAKPSTPSASSAKIEHIVIAKETKFSIAKLYNITQADLLKANPVLETSDVKIGQKLSIPANAKKSAVATTPKTTAPANQSTTPKAAPKATPSKPIEHTVQPKETKYGIATQYGLTVAELEQQNPQIKDNLATGTILKIQPKKTVSPSSATPNTPKNQTPNTSNTPNTSKPSNPNTSNYPSKPLTPNRLLDYTVKSGETMYSLTKQFNLSTEKLTALNPDIVNGVKEGMVLQLPANISFAKEKKSNTIDLSRTFSNQDKKEVVLLLPFNISKIESDTVNSMETRLKKDKFLNMTLDFYSGALMAIDSANVLGMNINVKIFDSQETKNSSNAINIVQSNALSANAIIGPFYQSNVEKLAEAIQDKNIPVISPLSKDYDKSFNNLYQSTPNNDDLKQAIFEYMQAKNGNIIAVIDPKKGSIKQYITENQKGVRLVGLSEKGGFIADSIKKLLVKDRMNYVVMESEKTGTIFTTTNALLASMKDYQVRLVILETNETLDFEEIDLKRLTKLKMTYPSLTRPNDSPEAKRFEKAYKRKNRILPNQYAVRGFDLTFDTLLRISQDKTFDESIQTTATEQIENKFDYAKNLAGGYTNKGIYILYYDDDLTIKQAE